MLNDNESAVGSSGSAPFTNSTAAMHVAVADGYRHSPTAEESIKLWALLLIFIPIFTILGNLLVIISVLWFKSLHSAINFLILGLAVADLMVALFVMPFAVYVEVCQFSFFREEKRSRRRVEIIFFIR
jgi:hypothetical protein